MKRGGCDSMQCKKTEREVKRINDGATPDGLIYVCKANHSFRATFRCTFRHFISVSTATEMVIVMKKEKNNNKQTGTSTALS